MFLGGPFKFLCINTRRFLRQVEGEGGSSASSLSPPVGAGGPLTDAHQEPCGGALEEEAPTRTYTEEELSLLAEEGLPEMETIELEVTKDHQGLGITIAGYVCEQGTWLMVVVLVVVVVVVVFVCDY